MKTTRILLALSILSFGCYTEAPLANDELAPYDSEVIFHLKDGTSIKSPPYQRSRGEGAYRVKGTLFKGDIEEEFDGTIQDDEIEKCGVSKLDTGGTLLAAALITGVFGIIFRRCDNELLG